MNDWSAGCKCKSTSPSKPDLLIGSSIIRDLVSNDDKSLIIRSHGGARTENILKIMNNVISDQYGDVFIQVGSNDCATKKRVHGIMENFDKLIATAKRVSSSGHITLSSICPRTDDTEAAAARGTYVYSRMQELAETRRCVRIDHEGTFLCNKSANGASMWSSPECQSICRTLEVRYEFISGIGTLIWL